jgi:hypothetical protein
MRLLNLHLAVFAALSTPVMHGAQTVAIPRDFRVVARMGNGSLGDLGDSPEAWDYTLRADGGATLKEFRFPARVERTTTRPFSLSQHELARTFAIIVREDFFSLPQNMDGQCTDTVTYILDITSAGKHRKVRVSCPPGVHDKRSLRRFRHVWEAICRSIPQPDKKDVNWYLR